MPNPDRLRLADAARARVLATHTAEHRAVELEGYLAEIAGAIPGPDPALEGGRGPRGGTAMKLVVFGLSVSSSWGNGHAVLWRALIQALGAQGHRTVFFERDVPWYAEHRDLIEIEGRPAGAVYRLGRHQASGVTRAGATPMPVIVTSYCPDGVGATEIVLDAPGLHVFYDLDTPVTLARLASGERLEAIGPRGLAPFDLVLSYTGGGALTALKERLGARHVARLGQRRPGPLSSRGEAARSACGAVLSRHLCRRPAG